MKPDYSIQTLADIRKDDIHAVAESLMAYGVTAYHRGKPFDLSIFERPPTIPNGGTIYVFTGTSRYEPTDPEHVIVLLDSLPAAWVKFISDGRVEENDEPDNTAPDPDKPKPPEFRPKVGWQIALFDSWLRICRRYSRIPTAAEAALWLRKNDDSGIISSKQTGPGLWWVSQRGKTIEVQLKTIENVISEWRAKGVLPA